MEQVIYCGELYHHGIKGQKWGVRRYQNEDGSLTAAGQKRYGTVGTNAKVKSSEIKDDKQKFYEEYVNNDPRGKKMKEYEKKAEALVDKYDFDADDGGGGTTAADRKAGKKYMEYWEKYGEIENDIRGEATKYANNKLVEKYGEERMNSYKTKENIKAGATVIAVLAYTGALVTHPLKTMGATIAVGTAALAYGIHKTDSELKRSQV